VLDEGNPNITLLQVHAGRIFVVGGKRGTRVATLSATAESLPNSHLYLSIGFVSEVRQKSPMQADVRRSE
jgi:hypothetical protein